ncbi:choice-of-anchor tandem repeat GloVer-containing protein [Peristeroidobacter soli]|uniref:choice-of-anchor tandem repeat GloVer-containing protein n=1 Tax=Peristeroidobacter soli TaxID=2497877 RepID=UPI00158C7E14|nr:choice-of-anchor tandem repeat GloVer-containing protein [Peristeroidobacter soli]
MNRSLSWLGAIPLTLLLAACGGGDGDSASAPANTDGGSTANNGGNTPVDTFSIGGTVSGLPDGTQLSLLDNGANAQSITSNGPFTLTEKLSAGSAYSVTLGAKPTGYQCNVTGGAGTMPASNITDVAIACTRITVTVGGSITGLNADGLTITNGNDTLEIPANATTFTLPTALAIGTPYNIAVSHIPTAVHCDVSNASGTAGDTPVDNVSVSCGPATLSTVYFFSETDSPSTAVTPGRDGNLYGISVGVWPNPGPDTIYKITPDGSRTVLWKLDTGFDGSEPSSPLLEGNDGNFYGMTDQGGTYGEGTVYRITPAGAETVLWSFGGPGDGWAPTGQLLQASDGNFYGITWDGGPGTRGAIFRLTPNGEERVMLFLGDYDLDANWYSGLIQGRDGNLYGQAEMALFKMTLDGTLSIVSSYAGREHDIGNSPVGSLIQANDGNFYGVMSQGGAYGAGTLFRVSPSGATTVLHAFGGDVDPDQDYGDSPTGAPFQAADGNLYGVSEDALYSVTLDGTYTVLHSFQDDDETQGYSPIDTISQGADGTLYGVTTGGGPNDHGSVFKLN